MQHFIWIFKTLSLSAWEVDSQTASTFRRRNSWQLFYFLLLAELRFRKLKFVLFCSTRLLVSTASSLISDFIFYEGSTSHMLRCGRIMQNTFQENKKSSSTFSIQPWTEQNSVDQENFTVERIISKSYFYSNLGLIQTIPKAGIVS